MQTIRRDRLISTENPVWGVYNETTGRIVAGASNRNEARAKARQMNRQRRNGNYRPVRNILERA